MAGVKKVKKQGQTILLWDQDQKKTTGGPMTSLKQVRTPKTHGGI